LPKSHIWECVGVERNKNKERAKGGFIVGKKREWQLKRCDLIVKKENGLGPK